MQIHGGYLGVTFGTGNYHFYPHSISQDSAKGPTELQETLENILQLQPTRKATCQSIKRGYCRYQKYLFFGPVSGLVQREKEIVREAQVKNSSKGESLVLSRAPTVSTIGPHAPLDPNSPFPGWARNPQSWNLFCGGPKGQDTQAPTRS